MSKKKSKKKKSISQKTNVSKPSKDNWLLYLGAVLLLTLLAMIPVFGSGILNYDDELYITQNPFIQSFDIGALFSDVYKNQYSPLAMSLMALQYKLGMGVGGLKTVSVLWHLLNTAWVFFIIKKLFHRQTWAVFVAGMFGVATLQLESVAWLAASMKIGTYAFFFLCSVWLYLRYLDASEKKYLWAALGMFVLSCLCKEQAVALTPTLLLIDFYKKRKWLSVPVLIEKIPFFIVSVLFGVLTLQASAADETKQVVYDFGLGERLLFVFYTLGSYVTKLTIPFNLSFFYTYPIEGVIPTYYYLYTLLFVGILGWLVQAVRSGNRTVVFALLFFGINIGLTVLTQLLSVRDVIMADRYVYLSAIGWFLCLVYVLEHFFKKYLSKQMIPMLGIGVLLATAVVTFLRGSVWKNSITIFSDVIQKEQYPDGRINPYLALPYNNRGIAYKRQGQLEQAMADFNKAIESSDRYASGFLNRGNIYFNEGKDQQALQDYIRTLELDPSNANAYSARGAIYAKQGNTQKALQDLDKAIELEPYFKDALSNRGLLYMQQGNLEASIADFSEILRFTPDAHDIYSTRGVVYARAGQFDQSIQDHTQAIRLQPSKGSYYLNRAYTYRQMGNIGAARQDAQRAQQLGANVPADLLH